MKVDVTGTKYDLYLEGPISEKTAIYDYNIKNATEIVLHMEKVSFINSIGVKNWIIWTLRVPEGASLSLVDCPFVIISQVNMVKGFLPPQARIDSFNTPFVCNSCGHETIHKMTRGPDYEYAQGDVPERVALPEIKCSKCGEMMEPDFIPQKAFGFLNPK